MSFASIDETETVDIHCLGCHEDFDGLRGYSAHDCPEPRSGEAFR